ncbi:uncharacterized protein LOC120130668 [Hibiscus syriacus]|uniref:uncharacterized protein LOC120130668 n=1 Tax=Hibiscus syriacus TaxID=106335 RepID=UPI001920DE73|nr:uncharacterized protein LOC120130668 [Hibiscus syriacus]
MIRLPHVAVESSESREGVSPGMRLPHVASNSAKTRVKRASGDVPFASSAERIHEGKRLKIEEIITLINSQCFDFSTANTWLQGPLHSDVIHWSPPPENTVKFNFDARNSQAHQSAWLGVIIRNNEGKIMGACRRFSPRITLPFAAEAQAAVHAMVFVLDLGFKEVIIEGDSRSVVSRLSSTDPDFSEIGAFIWDARRRSEAFSTRAFRFTPRNSNRAAHQLAAGDGMGSNDSFWIEEAPSLRQITEQVDEDRRWIGPPRGDFLRFFEV